MAKLQGCLRENGAGIVLIIANKDTRQSTTFGYIERSIVRSHYDNKLTPTGNSIPFSQSTREEKFKENE